MGLKWIDVNTALPEDVLTHKKYKLWDKERLSTDNVLVIREHRERPDCAKRVCIEGKWYWTDGDGVSAITHWAQYDRPVPWNQKEHDKQMKEIWKNKRTR